jgi:hypothetical protein
LTNQDDGTGSLYDESPLAKAADLGRVLFSKDQDFLRIAAQWYQQSRLFPGILFAAQQGVSLGGLADDLELLLTCCNPEELR